MQNYIKTIVWKEKGQAMVEYGFIVVLIAFAVVAALFILGPKVSGIYTNVGSGL